MILAQRNTSPVHIRDLRSGHSHAYGRRGLVIDGVSFTIGPGEILAIVAGNGQGKSTLIRAIVDVSSRWGGSVERDGVAVGYGEIAYVPQHPSLSLSPWRTVLKELQIPLEIRDVGREESRRRAESVLATLGISLPLERRVESLSGGQQVKLAIARALMLPDAKLVVLDEPFEGLDERSRNGVMEVLRRVAQTGVGILLTSHRKDDLTALNASILRFVGAPIAKLQREEAARSHDAASADGNENGDERGELDGMQKASIVLPKRFQQVIRSAVSSIASILVGLIAWQLAASALKEPSILPAPTSVIRAVVEIFQSTERCKHMSATVGRAIGCWLLAMVAAVPAGLVVGSSGALYRLLAPWLSLGRCLPVFALGGAVMGLFPGKPEVQRCFLIGLTLFLISFQIISFAAANATRRRWDFARIMGAGWWYRVRKVLFHESMGGIVSALEVTLPTSLIVTFVIEMTLLPQQGLGLYLFNHLTDRDLSVMYAYVFIPSLIIALGVWVIRASSTSLRRTL